MQTLHYRRKGFGLDRGRYQMDVVAHQAISKNRQSAERGLLPQEPQVSKTVRAAVKNKLAVGPALRNMMRHTWRDEAC